MGNTSRDSSDVDLPRCKLGERPIPASHAARAASFTRVAFFRRGRSTFEHSSVSIACAATAGMIFGMYGALFLQPVNWQATVRLDTVGTGIALMPSALVFVLVSSFSGPLESRLRNTRRSGQFDIHALSRPQ
jgi:hypothetical protein